MAKDVGSVVADLCRRPALTVRPSDRLCDAAERMVRAGVGSVIVERDRRPIGLLTDRDLALGALCDALDARVARVEDVMGHAPITIFEGEPLHVATQMIRAAHVRRLPVVDADGLLVGLLSADDLLVHAAGRLSGLCQVIRKQTATAREEERAHARD